MKKILLYLVLSPMLVIGQSQSENYVKATTYKQRYTSPVAFPDIDQAAVSVTYFDGLGRPIQKIAHKQSNSGKDIVTHIEYDEFGRQIYDYLPFIPSASPSLNFKTNETVSFYSNNNITLTGNPNFAATQIPFSQKDIENSPLNRVMRQSAPGEDWKMDGGHEIKYEYLLNGPDEVINFSISSSGGLIHYGYYKPNLIYKTITKDENWAESDGNNNTVQEFKDNFGRIILKRAFNVGIPHDTYYVYDKIGNLTYVLPPLFFENFIYPSNPSPNTCSFSSSINFLSFLNSSFYQGYTPIGSGGAYINVANGVIHIMFAAGFEACILNEAAAPLIIDPSQCVLPDMTVGDIKLGSNAFDYTVNIEHNRLHIVKKDPLQWLPAFTNLNDNISAPIDALFTETSIENATLNGLCYQYKYDLYNRLIAKKLPGKQWEFIVYDKLDRVVATGPALSPFSDLNPPNNIGWMITKYDSFNRPVLTGWMPSSSITSSVRATLQGQYDSVSLAVNETKSATDTVNGMGGFYTRYTNAAIPSAYATSYYVLTVNYYDDYTTNLTFNPAVAYTTSVTPQPVYYNNTAGTLPKGLPTVSWIRVPEATTTSPIKSEISYTLYDNKGRIVRTFKNNYLGGYTQVDSQLEQMTGRVNYTLTTHKRLAASTPITIREDFTYSAQDRLLTRTHTINNGNPQLLAGNTYDELGQLISKNVGTNPSTGAALQKVDYAYNIRGWLLGINKVSGLTQGTDPQDLFAFEINYNNPIVNNENNTIVPLYNGNIAETSWITKTDNIIRRYGYTYDALNRLKNSVYQKPFTGTAVPGSYNESLSYDKNGNITDLQRYGDLDSGSYRILIDNLTYTYHPDKQNQLMKVFDSSNHPEGFRDDSDGITDPVDDYSYDENGNLLSDENKGITSISYNHLNLPVKIIFYNDTNSRIEYLYNAQGEKVKKWVSQYCDTCLGGISLTTTDYLDGFQYTGNTLRLFPNAEGYVQNTVSGGNNIYSYVFNYTDHLGNIRASYAWNTATSSLKILEENHYYPFGLKHGKYNVNTYSFVETDDKGGGYDSGNGVPIKGVARSLYQYKFQGQELQDELGLNWYSFKYRNYDPAIARFMCIDPLAAKYPYNGVYNFSENRVIDGVELEGLEVQLIVDKGNYAKGDVGHTFVSVGSGKNMTVYTYGRWAGTDANSSGSHSPLNNGNGVMVKLTGKDALAEVQKYVKKFGAEVYQINNANEKKVGATLEREYNKSDNTPETGKYKGDERAHVIDKYDLSENNCTTKSLEAVNGAVPEGEIQYQTTVTAGGFPVLLQDGTKDTYAPKDLNKQLNQASQQSGSGVQKVTDKYD